MRFGKSRSHAWVKAEVQRSKPSQHVPPDQPLLDAERISPAVSQLYDDDAAAAALAPQPYHTVYHCHTALAYQTLADCELCAGHSSRCSFPRFRLNASSSDISMACCEACIQSNTRRLK